MTDFPPIFLYRTTKVPLINIQSVLYFNELLLLLKKIVSSKIFEIGQAVLEWQLF